VVVLVPGRRAHRVPKTSAAIKYSLLLRQEHIDYWVRCKTIPLQGQLTPEETVMLLQILARK
jgi:hypothetical protein